MTNTKPTPCPFCDINNPKHQYVRYGPSTIPNAWKIPMQTEPGYEQRLWDEVATVFMKEDLAACISTCVDIDIEAMFDCAFGNADKFMAERAKRIKERLNGNLDDATETLPVLR